ncbi:MAG TPA: hypothetical protein VHR66_07025 [Gemmataceae bacterium]|jgi:hypothetical protein|nr:hypothetical protein [Gemmataceae bacterium]
MNVFATVIPQLRQVLTHGRWFTPSVIVLFLGLEMFGRRALSDIHDTVGASVLLLILVGIAFRHRANPIPWVKKLGACTWFLARAGDRFKVDIGPDLRGTPHIARRLPTAVFGVVFLLAIWVVGASVVWWYSPSGWREPIVTVTYTGYLALMSLLWGMLFVASLGGVYFPIMLLTRLARGGRPGDTQMTRGQLVFLAAYLTLTTAAAWLLPLWPVLVVAGVCWLIVILVNLFPFRPGAAQLIWRSPRTRKVRSIPMRRLLLAVTTIAVLLLLALVMSAAGGRIFGQPDAENTMPLTTVMGNWLGWLTPGLLLSAGVFVFLAWRNDPSRPARPIAHIVGVYERDQKVVTHQLREHGWKANFGEDGVNDVQIKVVHPEASETHEFDPTWPLAVSRADLRNEFVYTRMARRDEIQLRRQLRRGLEKIFREAKGRTSSGGCGYWLAPHLWFVAGLTRDEVTGGEDEPAFLTEVVGPPYAEVFTLAERRYLYHLLKSLEVDLIFVEDGVGYRKLAKVLRVLFEVYDKGAGRKRSEDVHFRGLTKVRVMFHDFDVDEPFRPSSKYPEPKFAPLGRLRVLHIFRDRGGEEEFVEPPFNFDQTPVPSLVGV